MVTNEQDARVEEARDALVLSVFGVQSHERGDSARVRFMAAYVEVEAAIRASERAAVEPLVEAARLLTAEWDYWEIHKGEFRQEMFDAMIRVDQVYRALAARASQKPRTKVMGEQDALVEALLERLDEADLHALRRVHMWDYLIPLHRWERIKAARAALRTLGDGEAVNRWCCIRCGSKLSQYGVALCDSCLRPPWWRFW